MLLCRTNINKETACKLMYPNHKIVRIYREILGKRKLHTTITSPPAAFALRYSQCTVQLKKFSGCFFSRLGNKSNLYPNPHVLIYSF